MTFRVNSDYLERNHSQFLRNIEMCFQYSTRVCIITPLMLPIYSILIDRYYAKKFKLDLIVIAFATNSIAFFAASLNSACQFSKMHTTTSFLDHHKNKYVCHTIYKGFPGNTNTPVGWAKFLLHLLFLVGLTQKQNICILSFANDRFILQKYRRAQSTE